MASKLLIISIIILDLIAVGLAIAAERRRSVGRPVFDRMKQRRFCVYDSDVASSYGAGAFFILFFTQLLVMFASRCLCCGKPLGPGGSRACAIFLFFISWIFFLIAEICLFAASIRNAYHTRYTRYFFENPPTCEVIRKGVFAAGAAFTFLNAIISVYYYVSFDRARSVYRSPSTYEY